MSIMTTLIVLSNNQLYGNKHQIIRFCLFTIIGMWINKCLDIRDNMCKILMLLKLQKNTEFGTLYKYVIE